MRPHSMWIIVVCQPIKQCMWSDEATNEPTLSLNLWNLFLDLATRTVILDACNLKLWAIPDADSKCKNSMSNSICILFTNIRLWFVVSGKEHLVIDFARYGKSILSFFLTGLEADSRGILYTTNYYYMWICKEQIFGWINNLISIHFNSITVHVNSTKCFSYQSEALLRFRSVIVMEMATICMFQCQAEFVTLKQEK